ncbi:phosphate signaling complex PhoU family protein [Methanobacterium congolense]|uniref:Phosphate-specific transport system accessory protein PhoU n=1 Tax=Methanobacterium congolense TaxID=118062 RepID=A0A1D3L4B0_9EURY|nr:phosphate uptake regulator PhoU [Methanobacterium congolense]SCG86349.1 Phosphate-specific transport system accessory protein PhoU homolog 2 [Methanobacterium congolense]
MFELILESKLNSIQDDLLIYSEETVERINDSVNGFINNDVGVSRSIIESTDEINRKSYKIEQECLKILGLHQPLAKDLRLGAAVLRVSIELERINDLSAYISRYAIDSNENALNYHKPPHIIFMSETVQKMLQDGVGALLNEDLQLLKRCTKNYVVVQDFYNQMFEEYNDVTNSSSHTYLILVGRNLLSMGNHVMGMADRVAYSIVGKRVMHHKLFHNVLMR